MRYTLFFFICVLAVGCTSVVKTSDPVKKYDNATEVLFFYGQHRCATCTAIQELTTSLLNEEFASQLADSSIVFRVLDITEPCNEATADKYEASFTSLYVNRWTNGEETVNNLTDLAHLWALNNPVQLRDSIRAVINRGLNAQ